MSTTSYTAGNGLTVKLRTDCFINNEWCPAESGETFETYNPATEEVLANVAAGDKADVDKAVKAAREAFENGPWSKMDGAGRAKLLMKLADLIEKEENFKELATIEVANNGKPYNEYSNADLPLVVNHLRYYAGWADKITGETFNTPDQFIYTRKEPIGVVGQIIPWNFPLLMMAWKLGPALAAGCTVVLKPAEQTPLGALKLCDLIQEAGFPAGVVNVVTGMGPTAGAAISEHMDVDKVAFTGSVEVGRLVMQAAAKSNLKKVTLELGGKSPLVIFEDCDLDVAAEVSHQAIFFNQGEVCTAGSRVFVQESIYDAFIEKAKTKAEAREGGLGDPFSENTIQGAQVSSEQFDQIMKYIESGKEQGARLVAGGARKGDKGYFVKPTIFADVKSGMKIHDEEIFGPVLSVVKFKDMEDVIPKANDTTYGLAAAVITKDISKAFQLAHKVKAGTVWVNTYHQYADAIPFGGYRQSGIGREKGKEALDNYLEVKSVYVNYAS